MFSSKQYNITLAGKLNDHLFHKCIACLRYLEQEHQGLINVTYLQFFETQWEEYLKKTANENKGSFYNHKASPLVFLTDDSGKKQYIGDAETFMSWALIEFRYHDNTNMLIYKKKANDMLRNQINCQPDKSYMYMQLTFGGQAQLIVFELFTSLTPKTCENFMQLCDGFKGKSGKNISYLGSKIHRVVKGMYI